MISPSAMQSVDIVMRRVGFAMSRTSDTMVAWRKDLIGSHLILYFGEHKLYGAPHLKEWTLIHAGDNPSPDAKVRTIFDLDLLGALEAVRAIEKRPGFDYQKP